MAKKERVEVTIGDTTVLGYAGAEDEEGLRRVDFDDEGERVWTGAGYVYLDDQWIESGDIKPVK